jgi:putative intracellular protease/amidase
MKKLILSLTLLALASSFQPTHAETPDMNPESTTQPRTILIPLSEIGFDASEAGVPWSYLRDAGVRVIFATRSGNPAKVDPLINSRKNFPILFRASLATNSDGMRAFNRMIASPEFKHPIPWSRIPEFESELDAIYVPGGHYSGEYGTGLNLYRDGTTGVRQLIESEELQKLVGRMHSQGKLIAGICHGVLLLGRSIDPRTGRSIVEGRHITALPRRSEEFAIAVTRKTLGRYYQTYDITVQDELTRIVGPNGRFAPGPTTLIKDSPGNLGFGFVMVDKNLVTGRWQGDVHLMGFTLAEMLRIKR